jgi:ankyrin repeat protein
MLLESMSGFGAVTVAQPDDDGWTPLHYAAWYGHVAVVRYLLSCGAPLNARSPNQTCVPSLLFSASLSRSPVFKRFSLLHTPSSRSFFVSLSLELCLLLLLLLLLSALVN